MVLKKIKIMFSNTPSHFISENGEILFRLRKGDVVTKILTYERAMVQDEVERLMRYRHNLDGHSVSSEFNDSGNLQ